MRRKEIGQRSSLSGFRSFLQLIQRVQAGLVDCSAHVSRTKIQAFSERRHRERRKLQGLGEMKEIIGTDALGWLPDDRFERSKPLIHDINIEVWLAGTFKHEDGGQCNPS